MGRVFFKYLSKSVFTLAIALMATFIFQQQAFAQFTPEAGPMNQATSDAWQGAIRGVENEILNGIVMDKGAAGAGAPLVFFTTGRLRTEDHDRMKDSLFGQTVDFDSYEQSIFAGIKVSLPGEVFGGRVAGGAFLGHSQLDVDFGTAPLAGILTPAGDYDNDALIYGGYATFVHDAFYLLGTAAFADGDADFIAHPNNFSRNFDTEGYMLSAQMGTVIPLVSNINLDLRAGISKFDFDADKFLSSLGTFFFKNDLETTTLLLSAQLFTAIESNGMVIRPYIKGQIRNELDYDNTFKATFSATGVIAPPLVTFEQDDTVTNFELGANVTSGAFSFSAAGFGEWAGDRDGYGGRLAVKYKFN